MRSHSTYDYRKVREGVSPRPSGYCISMPTTRTIGFQISPFYKSAMPSRTAPLSQPKTQYSLYLGNPVTWPLSTVPEYLCQIMTYHVRNFVLCSSGPYLLVIPKIPLKHSVKRSVQTKVPRLWNKLPILVRVLILSVVLNNYLKQLILAHFHVNCV